MKATGCSRLALAIFLVAIAYSESIYAQSAEGYQLNRLNPTPAGDRFTLTESPQFSTEAWLAGRLTYDYARNSLVANVDGADSPISNTQYARLGVSGTFFGNLNVSLDVPMLLHETGSELAGLGPSGTVLSDPRLAVRRQIFARPDGAFSVSASLAAWVPVGSEDDLAGDEGLRLMPKLILGGFSEGTKLRWAVNAGYYYRESASLTSEFSPVGNTVGSEVRLAGALSYELPGSKISVGPEATLALAVDSDIPGQQGHEIAELFATGRYAISNEMNLGLGFGAAVAGSPGPAEFRGLLSFSYSPRSSRTTSSFEMVVLMPDEDGHLGSLEVDDGKNKTVLDTAYASTEVSKKNKSLRKVQTSAEALDDRVGVLAQVMPPVDRDADGIYDKDDSCPERAGKSSDDALRHGCPVASEKIVVLPDEDGNVGAIEVDDGNGVVLVDKAFASAEVGSGGKVEPIAPASEKTQKAMERAVAAVAPPLPPADADEDGIRDRDDACPDRKGKTSPDPMRNGCPPASEKIIVLPDADGHVGGLEIDDGFNKIVVDKAYASAEVAIDGKVAPQPPAAAPKVIAKAIAAVAPPLPPADGDGDGVEDSVDACPARKGLVLPNNPERNGCPKASERVVVLPDENGHVGSLEIDDGTTKMVLDKAFASSEVGSDGKVASVPSAAPAVVARNLKSVTAVMPKPDTDGDGIIDAHDSCPERAGRSNKDDARHGCPTAAETIVLLEDEDGHVGALEIGEGANMVVIDKAGATAEIASDGVMVQGETPKHFIEADFPTIVAVAKEAKKKLPKSAGNVHFTVHFNDKANPTRDVDPQIESLMLELKSRGDYFVEVVGHTDGTGSDRANLRVGLARASAIAKRIQERGVPAVRIGASTRGSSEPAVEVVDPKNVSAPLNRRVEIRIKDASLPQLVVPYGEGTRTTRSMRGEFKSFANRLKGKANLKIEIVGHVDATETKQKLALRRAQSVARQLTRAGISKSIIEVVSKDATDPAVEGEAGKAVPLNRRVEIFVKK